MAQCNALTKSGERCRREALTDTSFCSVHVDYEGELADSMPAPPAEVLGTETVEAVPVVETSVTVPMEEQLQPSVSFTQPDAKVKIKYVGRGTYFVGPYSFYRYGEEKEVTAEIFRHLIQSPYFTSTD